MVIALLCHKKSMIEGKKSLSSHSNCSNNGKMEEFLLEANVNTITLSRNTLAPSPRNIKQNNSLFKVLSKMYTRSCSCQFIRNK